MSHSEWAEAQLAEIELLSSMFPTVSEFEVTDQMALAELRDCVDSCSDSCSDTFPPSRSRPQFLIKQRIDVSSEKGVDVVLFCAYPFEYPSVLPEINVRCIDLNRAQQTRLQADLKTYLLLNCLGDTCVLSAVGWLKDNLQLSLNEGSPGTPVLHQESAAHSPPAQVFSRLWIYSHHIYNRSKRKNILEWAKELDLSGFSMPGKPGVVCVEGLHGHCEEFWSRVKALTWKRIMIRHREDVPLGGEEPGAAEGRVPSPRKFTGFEETSFDPHGERGNHMDLGLLYRFLSEKGCCEVFQMYFGVEGR